MGRYRILIKLLDLKFPKLTLNCTTAPMKYKI